MSFRRTIKKITASNYKLKCLIVRIINFFNHNDKIDKKNIDPTVILNKVRKIDRGKGNKIFISKDSKINNCSFTFYGSNNTVVIGENCNLVKMNIWCEDENNKIHIGKNTTINGETDLACIEGTSIHIGEDCMFSSFISFRTGDSHSIVDLQDQRINGSKDIHIGNHVWVGQNVFIGKGAKIADNSIVGACAVVTKQFDSCNVAIAGNPAKIIKEEINWKRERV